MGQTYNFYFYSEEDEVFGFLRIITSMDEGLF